MKEKIKVIIDSVGLPRIIILLFLVFLLILTPFVGLRFSNTLGDVIVRFGMNGILVLSLVPMLESGCGLNFGLQVGIIAGLLGSVISVEMNATGFAGFLAAIGIAIFFAVIFGFLYGILLNKVKGNEMVVGTYVGLSSVSFMCIMWLILPFKSHNMVYALGGSGLRPTISIDGYYYHILTDFLQINIGGIAFPTGTILFFALSTFLVWAFMRTKTGIAMTIAGTNPEYAKSCGVNVDKIRIISVILSTVIAAIGIVVYQEGLGFIQLYIAPLFMAFPTIAALLLGGASVGKVSIKNVIIGIFLFQGILTVTPSVLSNIIELDMSEVIRIIVSNGVIIYALTRVVRVRT